MTIGSERDGSQGKQDVNEFVAMLSKVTGNTYDVKDGKLIRTSERLNGKSDKTISGKLSILVEALIKDKENLTLTVVNDSKRDKDITFDNFLSGSVDLKDFKAAEKAGNPILAALLGHTLDEHGNVPNIKDRNPENKKTAHNCAVSIETNIMSEMLGVKLENRQDVNGPNKTYTKDVTVSIFTFDYKNVQYVLEQQILKYNQGTNSTPYSSGVIINFYRSK